MELQAIILCAMLIKHTEYLMYSVKHLNWINSFFFLNVLKNSLIYHCHRKPKY